LKWRSVSPCLTVEGGSVSVAAPSVGVESAGAGAEAIKLSTTDPTGGVMMTATGSSGRGAIENQHSSEDESTNRFLASV
jgi:hypothetical protein